MKSNNSVCKAYASNQPANSYPCFFSCFDSGVILIRLNHMNISKLTPIHSRLPHHRPG